MRIITNTCPDCGTIVAGNVVENHRVMKCPGLNCKAILRFEDLPTEEQEHLLENFEKYSME